MKYNKHTNSGWSHCPEIHSTFNPRFCLVPLTAEVSPPSSLFLMRSFSPPVSHLLAAVKAAPHSFSHNRLTSVISFGVRKKERAPFHLNGRESAKSKSSPQLALKRVFYSLINISCSSFLEHSGISWLRVLLFCHLFHRTCRKKTRQQLPALTKTQ